MQYKTYQDGERLIVVFENATPNLQREIEQRLGSEPVAAKQITGVAPPIARENTTAKQVTYENQLQQIPEINPQKELQEKGFLGFCTIYNYYNHYRDKLTSPCMKNLKNIILQQTQILKNRDVDAMSDEELKTILKYGGQMLFPKSMKECLRQSGYASLEDFLESGRVNLIDAYLACIVK